MALQSKNLLNEPPDIEELLNDLGHRLDRLKQLYEMYFLGIEKIEPGVARKEVQRAMLALQQQNIRNTGLRFKFNALLAKWNSYTTYWGRTIRAIENGTYVRHLQRAQRHAERDGKELPAEIVRIRERLLAATAQEKEQLRDEANAALKTTGAKAATAAAPATDTKPRAPSGQYSEFNALKNFLDDETDGFPRVEEDDLKPRPQPAPAPEQRAKSTTPPPMPPRPTATTPPPLPPRAPIPTPPGQRPAPPPPPTVATGARPGPPAPPAPPRPPASPSATASPSLPPRPTTVPVVPPKASPMAATQVVKTIPGMSENELRNLHQQYVAARQTSGENTKVSYEGLVGSLAKQVPRILEQPGVKGVRFEVTTKDGKAIVKAIPKKE